MMKQRKVVGDGFKRSAIPLYLGAPQRTLDYNITHPHYLLLFLPLCLLPGLFDFGNPLPQVICELIIRLGHGKIS